MTGVGDAPGAQASPPPCGAGEKRARRRLRIGIFGGTFNPVHIAERKRLKSFATRRVSDRYLGLGVGGTYTRYLQEIGGYDEAFVGWGKEDDDLHTRLRAYGLRREDISSEDTFYLHQFHAETGPSDPEAWEAGQAPNQVVFKASVTTQRNGPDWGTPN